jgi:hypothetical protein
MSCVNCLIKVEIITLLILYNGYESTFAKMRLKKRLWLPMTLF